MFLATLIAGLVLGGTYALVAMGLTLQYGIARTMNLAYGETIVAAAFAAFLVHDALGASACRVNEDSAASWQRGSRCRCPVPRWAPAAGSRPGSRPP